MRAWPLDEEALRQARLTFTRKGDKVSFLVTGSADPVEVSVLGGALQFIPERSPLHRAILQRLEAQGG